MKSLLSFLTVIFISSIGLLAQTNNLNKYNFRVKSDKLELKFKEVSGLNSETQTTQPKQGNSNVVTPRKLNGITKYSNATLKKGVALNTKAMTDFLNSTQRGPITIELLDENGNVAMTWTLANAYIVKSVKAVKGNELAIESMEIAHEGITMKQ